MQKEIFEQPAVIGDTLHAHIHPALWRVELPDLPFDLAGLPRITISACGTAYYAGMVAKYWFEQIARQPVELDIASEFRYREAPLPEGGLGLFISQSGETADTLAALRYAKAEGPEGALGGQRAGEHHRAGVRRRAAHPGGPGDRRRLDQGLHHPAGDPGLPGDRHGAGARRHRQRPRGRSSRTPSTRCRRAPPRC